MSFKSITFILISFLLVPRSYSKNEGLIVRMRGVPVDHRYCALAVTSEDSNEDTTEQWESAIDHQDESLKQILDSAKKKQTLGLRKLKNARALLEAEHSTGLASLAPFVLFLDDVSHERWTTLKNLGVRLAPLKLSHIPILGADAEFSMTYFDGDEKLILFNVALGLDTWVYSKASKDVEDLDVVVAGQLASAVFYTRTTHYAFFNEAFVKFCRDLENEYPEMTGAFESSEAKSGPTPWESDLIGQMWTYFKERLALQESLRVYTLLRTKNHNVYSFRMAHLERLPKIARKDAIDEIVQSRFQIKPEVIKALRNTPIPKAFLN